MTLVDDTCDSCGGRFDPMGDPLLTKHPEIGPYAVFCATCEQQPMTADRVALSGEIARVLGELADDFESNVDWSSGRNNYGDNEAWESAARQVRATSDALADLLAARERGVRAEAWSEGYEARAEFMELRNETRREDNPYRIEATP